MIMRVSSSAAMSGAVQGGHEMTNGRKSRHIGVIAIGCGLIGTSIYLLMIKVTLARIEKLSGHTPFDMRPLG